MHQSVKKNFTGRPTTKCFNTKMKWLNISTKVRKLLTLNKLLSSLSMIMEMCAPRTISWSRRSSSLPPSTRRKKNVFCSSMSVASTILTMCWRSRNVSKSKSLTALWRRDWTDATAWKRSSMATISARSRLWLKNRPTKNSSRKRKQPTTISQNNTSNKSKAFWLIRTLCCRDSRSTISKSSLNRRNVKTYWIWRKSSNERSKLATQKSPRNSWVVLPTKLNLLKSSSSSWVTRPPKHSTWCKTPLKRN